MVCSGLLQYFKPGLRAGLNSPLSLSGVASGGRSGPWRDAPKSPEDYLGTIPCKPGAAHGEVVPVMRNTQEGEWECPSVQP